MTRSENQPAPNRVTIRLSPALAAAVDARRGATTRIEFIRQLLARSCRVPVEDAARSAGNPNFGKKKSEPE